MGQTACPELWLAASEAAETSSHPSQPAREGGEGQAWKRTGAPERRAVGAQGVWDCWQHSLVG